MFVADIENKELLRDIIRSLSYPELLLPKPKKEITEYNKTLNQ